MAPLTTLLRHCAELDLSNVHPSHRDTLGSHSARPRACTHTHTRARTHTHTRVTLRVHAATLHGAIQCAPTTPHKPRHTNACPPTHPHGRARARTHTHTHTHTHMQAESATRLRTLPTPPQARRTSSRCVATLLGKGNSTQLLRSLGVCVGGGGLLGCTLDCRTPSRCVHTQHQREVAA